MKLNKKKRRVKKEMVYSRTGVSVRNTYINYIRVNVPMLKYIFMYVFNGL